MRSLVLGSSDTSTSGSKTWNRGMKASQSLLASRPSRHGLVNAAVSWPGTLASVGLNPTMGRLGIGAIRWHWAYLSCRASLHTVVVSKFGFLVKEEIFLRFWSGASRCLHRGGPSCIAKIAASLKPNSNLYNLQWAKLVVSLCNRLVAPATYKK